MLDTVMQRRGFLVYGELISYILQGYDNDKLKKIIQLKRIKTKGFSVVNDKTRNTVLKNLSTKNNLFELYKIWNAPKNKITESPEDEMSLDDVIKKIDLGEINSLEGTSMYLSEMIAVKGFEETIIFWTKNKEMLERVRLKTEEDRVQVINEHPFLENDAEERKKIEKKYNKEFEKWQKSEHKLNKKILQLNKDILNFKSERINMQKKHANILDELKIKSNEESKYLSEQTKLISQIGALELALKSKKSDNNKYIQKNINNEKLISEMKNTIEAKEDIIKSLHDVKQNREITDISLVNVVSSKSSYLANEKEMLECETVINNLNTKQDIITEVYEEDTGNRSSVEIIKTKKILVFGDITGFDYEENLFEVYTRDVMPEDISVLEEENYKAIWLIQYRFPKKSQRNQVMKKFENIKVINNFIELEGVYKNEL